MEIFDIFYQARNPKNAEKMAAYMKNRFPFLGIPKPDRAKLSRDFMKAKKRDETVDWPFVWQCYEKEEREFTFGAGLFVSCDNCLLAGRLAISEKNGRDPLLVGQYGKSRRSCG